MKVWSGLSGQRAGPTARAMLEGPSPSAGGREECSVDKAAEGLGKERLSHSLPTEGKQSRSREAEHPGQFVSCITGRIHCLLGLTGEPSKEVDDG